MHQDALREYTKSDYTRYLSNNDKTTFADKMRMADVAGDVITVTTGWQKDGGLVHPRNDNFVDFDHGTALIMSGNNQYRAEIVVGITDKGEYVFYDVTNINPDTYKMKEEPHTTATTDKPIGDINRGSSDDNVSQPSDTVKEKLLSDRDNDYMKAVQDGDTETAQRMVDDAAKKAGYSVRMFHGAKKGGGFTVFRDWSYFTQNEAYARRYMNQSNREDGNSLYSVYVNLGKTFDTRKAKDRKLFNQIRMEMGLGEIGERGLLDWTDGYDLSEYIEENELPYDSIVLDEGGDMVNGKPVYRGDSYVVRDSSSVKSADPVTYDDDGNVIPLSQRFQKEQKDIRYSARETEVSQAETDLEDDGSPVKDAFKKATDTVQFKKWFGHSKVVDENGKPKVLYHQTSADFTIFDTRHEGAGSRDQDTPFGMTAFSLSRIRAAGAGLRMRLLHCGPNR